jgi:hypothetical protein
MEFAGRDVDEASSRLRVHHRSIFERGRRYEVEGFVRGNSCPYILSTFFSETSPPVCPLTQLSTTIRRFENDWSHFISGKSDSPRKRVHRAHPVSLIL